MPGKVKRILTAPLRAIAWPFKRLHKNAKTTAKEMREKEQWWKDQPPFSLDKFRKRR